MQFCHPRPWTILSPVPSCCTPENPQRFSAISAADALDEVLYQINLVETARRVSAPSREIDGDHGPSQEQRGRGRTPSAPSVMAIQISADSAM